MMRPGGEQLACPRETQGVSLQRPAHIAAVHDNSGSTARDRERGAARRPLQVRAAVIGVARGESVVGLARSLLTQRWSNRHGSGVSVALSLSFTAFGHASSREREAAHLAG